MKKIPLLAFIWVLPLIAHAGSTINNANAFSYGANIGWLNWHGSGVNQPPGTYGVNIGEYICQGWIYGANVGWISMCRKDVSNNDVGPTNHIQYSNTGNDYGVNYVPDPTTPGVAYLRGLAYGANIGWINFDSPTHPFPGSVPLGMRPQISLFTGKMHGYAYSANCGWISLDEFETAPGNPLIEHYVQTDHVLMGVDSDGDGIADAFEYQYFGNTTTANGVTDADGDGLSDKDEYLDGTSPVIANSRLHITAFGTNSGGTSSTLTWTSTTARLYQIQTKTDLLAASWDPDPTFGTLFAPDAGTTTTRTLTAASAVKRYYRVKTMRPLP